MGIDGKDGEGRALEIGLTKKSDPREPKLVFVVDRPRTGSPSETSLDCL